MPTHIHLLIKPAEQTNLSIIMHWIKIHSAKRWNCVHGSADHLWGSRYFARAVKTDEEYNTIMDYIDQNAVVVGLAATPEEWKASGAFYKSRNLTELIDIEPEASPTELRQLPPIPLLISNLLPPSKLEHTKKYYGSYAAKLDDLFTLAIQIPNLGKAIPPYRTHFRYHIGTTDYHIYEYDGQDTMYGKVRTNIYPAKTECKTFSLAELKKGYLEW